MWEYGVGIPDELFIRTDVPMTKQEVRAVIISKLRLKKSHTVWDIGAGTGSVSIETARVCSQGEVYSIDSNEEALRLVKENAKVFGVSNIKTLHGQAPLVLKDLPKPDRIFIGGSGEELADILKVCVDKIESPGVIVLSSITLDSIYLSQQFFKEQRIPWEVVCINIARSKQAGAKTMMIAQNPIYVLSAEVK
ncbi:MAG TPA: precorrin-6Y C5,15-methyltransferase (decarboxylating) subunit CbiT [Tepidimicrobium sp.]|nr:precorrin-6Y C5,15-methyltransferase (decarboxylating) subunit CbiT [Tepidimicrobium sp.]